MGTINKIYWAAIGLLLLYAAVDENDYFHYTIMNNVDREVSLPFTGAASSELYLHNYPNATNPTYSELRNFILSDNTDQIPYNYNSFVCADYAVRVHNNAEKAGIKAGVVSVEFSDVSGGHALNVFNTTDRGIIYIDCTNSGEAYGNEDTIINSFQVGALYQPTPLIDTSAYYYEPLGTIKSYELFW